MHRLHRPAVHQRARGAPRRPDRHRDHAAGGLISRHHARVRIRESRVRRRASCPAPRRRRRRPPPARSAATTPGRRPRERAAPARSSRRSAAAPNLHGLRCSDGVHVIWKMARPGGPLERRDDAVAFAMERLDRPVAGKPLTDRERAELRQRGHGGRRRRRRRPPSGAVVGAPGPGGRWRSARRARGRRRMPAKTPRTGHDGPRRGVIRRRRRIRRQPEQDQQQHSLPVQHRGQHVDVRVHGQQAEATTRRVRRPTSISGPASSTPRWRWRRPSTRRRGNRPGAIRARRCRPATRPSWPTTIAWIGVPVSHSPIPVDDLADRRAQVRRAEERHGAGAGVRFILGRAVGGGRPPVRAASRSDTGRCRRDGATASRTAARARR